MTRPRAPAFAKQLLAQRREGRHPLVVHLEYSEHWFRRDRCNFFCEEHPFVSVKPSEFEPGRFDWHVLTGVCVELFDPGGELDGGTPAAPQSPERLRQLVLEVGRLAGPIWIYGPHRSFPLAPQWLPWWTPELEAINGKRREAWGRAWLAECDRRFPALSRAA